MKIIRPLLSIVIAGYFFVAIGVWIDEAGDKAEPPAVKLQKKAQELMINRIAMELLQRSSGIGNASPAKPYCLPSDNLQTCYASHKDDFIPVSEDFKDKFFMSFFACWIIVLWLLKGVGGIVVLDGLFQLMLLISGKSGSGRGVGKFIQDLRKKLMDLVRDSGHGNSLSSFVMTSLVGGVISTTIITTYVVAAYASQPDVLKPAKAGGPNAAAGAADIRLAQIEVQLTLVGQCVRDDLPADMNACGRLVAMQTESAKSKQRLDDLSDKVAADAAAGAKVEHAQTAAIVQLTGRVATDEQENTKTFQSKADAAMVRATLTRVEGGLRNADDHLGRVDDSLGQMDSKVASLDARTRLLATIGGNLLRSEVSRRGRSVFSREGAPLVLTLSDKNTNCDGYQPDDDRKVLEQVLNRYDKTQWRFFTDEAIEKDLNDLHRSIDCLIVIRTPPAVTAEQMTRR